MHLIKTLLLCVICLAMHVATHARTTRQPHASISLTSLSVGDFGNNAPAPALMRVHYYSAHRNKVTNRLLIAGAACVAVGLPTLIYGLSEINKPDPTGIESSNYVRGMPIAVLGGVLTAGGIGFIVPASVLKFRNNRPARLEE